MILHDCQRPYHVECTASRPISEVKQRWAWLVLGWVTAWEHQVLLAFLHIAIILFLLQTLVHLGNFAWPFFRSETVILIFQEDIPRYFGTFITFCFYLILAGITDLKKI